MDLTCALCPRTDSAYICREHLPAYTRALDLAFAVLNSREVETTVARLDRMPERGGRANPVDNMNEVGKSDGALRPTALPVNLDAARRADTAIGELTTWARHIAEQRGIPLGTTGDRRPIHGPVCQGQWVDHPDGRMWQQCQHQQCAAIRHGRRPVLVPAAVACRFLASNAEWLRHRPEAVEAWPAIEAAAKTLTRLVDSPPELELVGACSCGVRLYARTRAATVTCRQCGAAWNTDSGRAEMTKHIRASLVTAAEYVTLHLRQHPGRPRKRVRDLIAQWARRGHIQARGTNADGDPLYRYGDIDTRMIRVVEASSAA